MRTTLALKKQIENTFLLLNVMMVNLFATWMFLDLIDIKFNIHPTVVATPTSFMFYTVLCFGYLIINNYIVYDYGKLPFRKRYIHGGRIG